MALVEDNGPGSVEARRGERVGVPNDGIEKEGEVGDPLASSIEEVASRYIEDVKDIRSQSLEEGQGLVPGYGRYWRASLTYLEGPGGLEVSRLEGGCGMDGGHVRNLEVAEGVVEPIRNVRDLEEKGPDR